VVDDTEAGDAPLHFVMTSQPGLGYACLPAVRRRSMTFVLQLAPRVVALVAWALALTVAAGASTPRLRTPGRERVARAGIVRAGSQRPDDPRAWVAPGTEHDPEYTVADGVADRLAADAVAPHDAGPAWPLVPALPVVAALSSSAAPDLTAPRGRLTRALARATAGRAPPSA